jgi:alanine dehydrogenase
MIFTTAKASSSVEDRYLRAGGVLSAARAARNRRDPPMPQPRPVIWRAATPSSSAARSQRLGCSSAAGAGAVSAMNCSSAATIAAVSESDAPAVSISICGRGGFRSPFRPLIAAKRTPPNLPIVSEIPVFDADAVFAAVSPAEAVDRTLEAFERHAAGEWVMPAKVYVDAPPEGDFRAMPARGAGLAILKWVTSFPHNPARGLPVVAGVLVVSSAESGELVALLECGSVTSLRTGAAAAVSARTLARDDARSVGIIGCGVNGAWAARCLVAAGYGPGVCADARPEAAATLAAELGWRAGDRAEAAAQDVVVTVTPGETPVIAADDLRPGQHFAVLGADAHGKAEVAIDALARCRLFCDEWEQASKGGELSSAVDSGVVTREEVIEIGSVLRGAAPGRRSADEVTLFDSTGLAIQDLGIALAVLDAWRAGQVEAPTVSV